ncbi:hypothetical protein [Paenibacillus pini]|uniref:Uncharacterized protein n=1 Tax=Paenibacillus pini JCM 16418 TaxID=1236976 RepID=W7Z7L9_9BACL|nr:hypothetical protein [Paenibacillus pini]GAF10394.1 hypothetical protein JCM16418_4597 [Paenibacillus pini JCM 16418]
MNSLEETVKQTIKTFEDNKIKEMFQFEKNKLYAYLEEIKDSLIKHKAFIAGGTITSLLNGSDINDLDIYFRNEESLIDFLKEHWKDDNSYVTGLTKKSVLMISGKEPKIRNVQLIHFKYFNTPDEIFETFDFTACMGAYDFSTEQFVLHQQFLKHNSQRILKFNKNTAFPIVSLLRVQKYNGKGYTISKPEFIRIALKCMELDIKTVEDLKDHLGGMYGINYDKIIDFEEGEEFSLDKVIDKIADIALDEDYFKEPISVKYEDLDDIIDTVKKRPIHILTLRDKYFRVTNDNQLKSISTKAAFSKDIDADKYFENKRFYKWVEKDGYGKYRSHYDGDFKYEDGRVSTALGDKLFFNEKQNITYSTYWNKGVLIEVSTKPVDFIDKSSEHIYLKSCTVIREVPKTEWKQWVNEGEDDHESVFDWT